MSSDDDLLREFARTNPFMFGLHGERVCWFCSTPEGRTHGLYCPQRRGFPPATADIEKTATNPQPTVTE